MNRLLTATTIGGLALFSLYGCSSDDNSTTTTTGGGGGTGSSLISYVGSSDSFAAWVNDVDGSYAAAPIGSYAAKKQSLRGTLDYLSGANLGQLAGVEVYEGSDGHVYALDLTSGANPAPAQLSSETAATVDDTCTSSGSAVSGANYNYAGAYFTADLVTPTNSSYFYRLPGPDGVCNTADDVIHMVKTGMAITDAPVVASSMPVATVRTAQGGISGFVMTSGTDLIMVDSNLANPVTLGSFQSAIGVADPSPVGTVQGYPTGQLYVVDGNIVYVNYAAPAVSASLFTIPGWTATKSKVSFAASPTTLYFAVNTPASGPTAASAALYSMPADGSAGPTMIDSQSGEINTLLFPVNGSNLIWGLGAAGSYTISTLVEGGSPTPTTLLASSENGGTFIATASTVYYTTWDSATDSQALTVTHSNTTSGMVGIDGTTIGQPLANSTFVAGGELQPWPNDTVTTQTALETVFQVQNLTSVAVTDTTTGYQYTEDGVSGGTMIAIDTTSNAVGVTVGTLPVSTAVNMNGTFRDAGHSGFFEALNPLSTRDPATRDLYLLNSQIASSLTQVTSNL